MQIEPFALERWMTRWELLVTHDICESGIKPLSLGDVMGLIPASEAAVLEQRIHETPLGYSEARGTEDLRSVLATTYANTSSDDILITTGAIEANYLLFNVLLKAGDHVVVVDPAYQQLASVPKAIGCQVDHLSVVHSDGYYYDLDELRGMVRPDTRMIVINTPHNPTGCMLSASDLNEIVELARENDCWILCDEAYRWIEHPGGMSIPGPMRGRYEKGISVGTVSKPFGVPGLRIGWFAAPAEIAQAAWGIRDYVSLSPAKLSDLIATAVIRNREAIFARNSEIIAANLVTANQWFTDNADIVSWQAPKAGLLAMMRYAADLDSSVVADRLAGDVGVMLAPGDAFGMPGTLRIGVGQDPRIFREGLEMTAQFLRTLG
ncbi:MAG: aminotransferase class I/II-fold pyridoxal phosphate-dependent enzyme [Thermomicrobiales bacterium]|nr:aminotransferase class I/II-fold pyridoxal phosphate-dependent enzyme [Thermomicrobiales bacterium]